MSLSRFTTRTMSRIVLGIAVLGCIFGGIVLVGTAGSTPSAPGIDGWDTDDVAGSWGRYNEGVPEEEPSWSADEFIAAVGDGTAGRVVQMPGSSTFLDLAQVEAAIAGTDLLVVTTPPSPLGATETTRIRDNTVQKYWGNDQDVQLVMVHGTNVYVPSSDSYGIIIGTTAGPGKPAVDSLLYSDATQPVLKAVAGVLDGVQAAGFDRSTPVPTTPEELAPQGREPTDAELAEVLDAIGSSGRYVDPEVVNPPDAASWPALGEDAAVAIFPTAAPGQYVDYAAALHRALPDRPVVVVTGSWVQTAGLDDQRALDVMMQVRAVAGFPLAGSDPDPQRLLTMYGNVYEVASAASTVHTAPPSPLEGIPRWLAYLALGASLTLVAGFALGSWLESRARGREAWQVWRDRVTGLLLERYVDLTGALGLSLASDSGTAEARRGMDEAYGMLLESRGIATRAQAVELVTRAWRSLDLAAARLDRTDLAPSGVLPAEDRAAPVRSEPGRTRASASGAPTQERRRPATRKNTTIIRRAGYVLAGVLGAVVLQAVVSSPSGGVPAVADDAVSGLRGSNAYDAVAGGGVDIDGVRQAISTRWLILVYADGDGYDLAESVAGAYPEAVVFVLKDGRVDAARIGQDAAVDGYDVYSLIDDYYDVQGAMGAEPVAQVRQLALLYDRLAAEGSINAIDRLAFRPLVPWGLVAVGLVVALAVAGFLVYAATSRITQAQAERANVAGQRDALRLRLAESATQLLRGAPVPLEKLTELGARERALGAEVQSAPAEQLAALRERIDAFDEELNRVLASTGRPSSSG